MGEYDYEAGHHLVGKNEPAQPKETIGFRLNHLMVRIKVSHLSFNVDRVQVANFAGSSNFYSFLSRCPGHEKSFHVQCRSDDGLLLGISEERMG